MKLAPPNPSNIAGATFGKEVRKKEGGGKKAHRGIDLAATVGTPIYAITSGNITIIVSEQPNRNGSKNNQGYPVGYIGDKRQEGNRIYIVSGNKQVMYMHLQAGNAIAINPRTGQQFKVGDAVSVGDIIGYVGITGNANSKVPHLHLGYAVDGEIINPEPLLNILYGISTMSVIIQTPCD